MNQQFTLKVIVLGDADVGKTSYLNRLVYGKQGSPLPTIALDYFRVTVPIANGIAKVQVWDTGSQKFNALAQSFFKNVDGVLAFFDLSRPQTSVTLQRRVQELKEQNDKQAVIVLIGSKVDLVTKTGSYQHNQQVKEFIAKNKSNYFQVSSKTGLGIEESFKDLVSRAVSRPATGKKGFSLKQQQKECCTS